MQLCCYMYQHTGIFSLSMQYWLWWRWFQLHRLAINFATVMLNIFGACKLCSCNRCLTMQILMNVRVPKLAMSLRVVKTLMVPLSVPVIMDLLVMDKCAHVS